METGKRMKEQLISIIVPVYNGEAYLDRCVQSIIAQSYSFWELLLIDNASTDRTPVLCDAWQKEDERIRVLHESVNRGVSAGRNKGLREARGEYLMFVDADDWLLPDCLERLYGDIQKPGVEIAGCTFRSCTDSDWDKNMCPSLQWRRESKPSQKKPPAFIAGKDFLREGILKRDTRCWGKLYRRNVIEGHHFREDYTIGEDMLFVWEVAKDAELISSSAYPGYCYYHNMNGAMLKPFRETDIDQIRCWQFLLATLVKENMQAQIHDNDVISQTASILLISCMLVAGKLAFLPGDIRKHYADIQKKCSLVLRRTLKIPGAFEKLDWSYKLKVRIYDKVPGLYLFLYHICRTSLKVPFKLLIEAVSQDKVL